MATCFEVSSTDSTDFEFQQRCLYLPRGFRECFAPKNVWNPGVVDEDDEISAQAFFEDRCGCEVAGLVVLSSPSEAT